MSLVNPCLVNNGGCNQLSECSTLSDGTVNCTACPPGYSGNGTAGCVGKFFLKFLSFNHPYVIIFIVILLISYFLQNKDINECAINPNLCERICVNRPGSYSCEFCPAGYVGNATFCAGIHY